MKNLKCLFNNIYSFSRKFIYRSMDKFEAAETAMASGLEKSEEKIAEVAKKIIGKEKPITVEKKLWKDVGKNKDTFMGQWMLLVAQNNRLDKAATRNHIKENYKWEVTGESAEGVVITVTKKPEKVVEALVTADRLEKAKKLKDVAKRKAAELKRRPVKVKPVLAEKDKKMEEATKLIQKAREIGGDLRTKADKIVVDLQESRWVIDKPIAKELAKLAEMPEMKKAKGREEAERKAKELARKKEEAKEADKRKAARKEKLKKAWAKYGRMSPKKRLDTFTEKKEDVYLINFKDKMAERMIGLHHLFDGQPLQVTKKRGKKSITVEKKEKYYVNKETKERVYIYTGDKVSILKTAEARLAEAEVLAKAREQKRKDLDRHVRSLHLPYKAMPILVNAIFKDDPKFDITKSGKRKFIKDCVAAHRDNPTDQTFATDKEAWDASIAYVKAAAEAEEVAEVVKLTKEQLTSAKEAFGYELDVEDPNIQQALAQYQVDESRTIGDWANELSNNPALADSLIKTAERLAAAEEAKKPEEKKA